MYNEGLNELNLLQVNINSKNDKVFTLFRILLNKPSVDDTSNENNYYSFKQTKNNTDEATRQDGDADENEIGASKENDNCFTSSKMLSEQFPFKQTYD